MICSGRIYLLLQLKFKIKLDRSDYITQISRPFTDVEKVKVYNSSTRNCVLRNNKLIFSANMVSECDFA
jgi:hypothetical protein